MDLIHTVGIGIDAAPAKAGAAQAASAFAQVAESAQSMSGTAQAATSALGPLGTALGVVAKALSAIDPSALTNAFQATSVPITTLQGELKSASAEAQGLRKNLDALSAAGAVAAVDARRITPKQQVAASFTNELSRSKDLTLTGTSNRLDDMNGDRTFLRLQAPIALPPPIHSDPTSLRTPQDLSFPSASSMAPAQLTALPGLNFAAMPQDIAATSASFDTLKLKVDSTSDAAMRLHTRFAALPAFNNEFRKPDDPLSLRAIQSEAELRKSQLKPLPAPPPPFPRIPASSSLLPTPLTLLPPKETVEYFPGPVSLAPAPLTLSIPKPASSSEEKKPSPPRSSFYQFQEGMLQSTSAYGDLGKQSKAAGEDTTGVLKSAFSTFFTDALLQRAKAPKPRDAFHTMMKTIRNAMEDIMIKKFVAEPVTGLVTGWFGNLFKGPAPASASGLLGGVGGLVSNVLKFLTLSGHTGGVVGSSFGTMMLRDPALFIGAPRLHHGLAPDEFPAILQRGERVVPKSQAGAWDRGGGDININVSVDGSRGGTPAQNKAFGAEVARQIEAMVDARIARAAMPRGILRPAAGYA